MVYVRTSTLNWIEDTVDSNNGAAIIRNASVRDREGKDRLRLTRLQAVRNLIVRRGLRTFPDRLLYSGENWSFAVYRPELLVVDVGVLADDPEKRAALEFVMDALNQSAHGQFFVSEHSFRRNLLTLASAHPEIRWQFKQQDAIA
ncbi:hypothetical protein OEB94_18825 [Streptomyces sp. ICN988]|uniref:hypothetical protein n=1 Tax=Streptomyces sp. ICN988 TaxID=2983765 RepID=UPI0021E42252|nr:hypothetical protein [Streptomyces sp. ICN988]MCV2461332.1 hypothetical protein [Streptomyces sp. ICN988]